MKMNNDQAWLKKKAEQEDGCFVSVGGLVEALDDLILRTTLRGVVARQHANRFPHSSAEAVRYVLLTRKSSIRQRGKKNNV